MACAAAFTWKRTAALKTGRDVAVAALLGAEEFGFATAPLVVLGCIMMRVCHMDTCPVVWRRRTRNCASGSRQSRPRGDFMKFIAQELREIMAKLGIRKIEDMVGRTDKLVPWKAIDHWKAKGLDLTPIFASAPAGDDVGRFRQIDQDHGLGEITRYHAFAEHLRTCHSNAANASMPICRFATQSRRRHHRRQRCHEETRPERFAG